MWTVDFQMFKLVLEKAEEPEIKLPTSVGSSKKQESFRKTCTSALLTMPKPLSVWITTNCGKFWKRWEYQTTWPASWEICMQVKKQQLELHMEQQSMGLQGVGHNWVTELNWSLKYLKNKKEKVYRGQMKILTQEWVENRDRRKIRISVEAIGLDDWFWQEV